MNRRAVWFESVLTGLLLLGLAGTSAAQNDFIYRVNPPIVRVSSGRFVPSQLPFCGTEGLPFICYPPSFIRAAYNFPSNLDGTGQTILIVVAFGSPTIREDLAFFDESFGISDPPSFTILCPNGGCPSSSFNNKLHSVLGWSIETTLDVEYAHAMAPGANIVLVVAATSSGSSINVAERKAIQLYPGSVMSQSFGIPEILIHGNNFQVMQAHKNYLAARQAGITVLAATGDGGATLGAHSTANALFPSSDPLVTAVGGSEGLPYPGGLAGCGTATCTGLYGGEQVWNEPVFENATGGGAPSLFFSVPSYQINLGLTKRTTPDISYNAADNGSVLIFWSAIPSQAGFYGSGGTSAGTPQWAAIFALANQLSASKNLGSLGFVNPVLYQLAESVAYSSDFHDITVGNNQLTGTPVGFPAAMGWDDASGWGTPNVANLVPDLVKCAKTATCP